MATKSVTSTAYHSHTHPHDRSHNPPQAMVFIQFDEKHLPRAPIPEDPFDENVYNLIPIEVHEAEKAARYRSKFAGMARKEYKAGVKPAASMGPAKVAVPKPNQFLKKGQSTAAKTITVKKDTEAKTKEAKSKIKAPLPKEQGVQNEKTQKDYVRMNALENIHSLPKKVHKEPPRFIAKKDYGTVPDYLIKRKIEAHENEILREQMEEERKRREIMESGLIPLPEEERVKILEGLKANWEKLNLDYIKLSLTVDTVPKINRKVSLENSLKKLEEDIQKFSHPNILVDFNYATAMRAAQ